MNRIREQTAPCENQGPRRLRALLFLALTATAWFASSPARAEPVVGGKVMIKLTNTLDAQLKGDEIGVRAWHRWRRTRTVTLEVSGGSFELDQSDSPTGHLRLRGGIRLRSGDREVRIRELSLDMSNARLLGSIGDRDLVVADTEARRSYPRGSQVTVATDLYLARPAARLLNAHLLPAHPFVPGERMAFLNGIVFLASAPSAS